jgi:hypothetical protein
MARQLCVVAGNLDEGDEGDNHEAEDVDGHPGLCQGGNAQGDASLICDAAGMLAVASASIAGLIETRFRDSFVETIKTYKGVLKNRFRSIIQKHRIPQRV